MKVLNVGSLNLDHVYTLAHFVQPGETAACEAYSRHCGGKGLNQSVALARAGAETCHVGMIGPEGADLKAMLAENGVGTGFVRTAGIPGGHAVIQVNPDGQNCIIVYGGANRTLTRALITEAAGTLSPGDFLLMQNETNLTDAAARLGKERGARIVLNPSPVDDWLVRDFPFETVDILILNETEGTALTGRTEPDEIGENIRARYSGMACVLTLGEKGSLYFGAEGRFFQPAHPAVPVDATGAGDTFTGYFLAERLLGAPPAECLAVASRAAAAAVSAMGAAESIPRRRDILP